MAPACVAAVLLCCAGALHMPAPRSRARGATRRAAQGGAAGGGAAAAREFRRGGGRTKVDALAAAQGCATVRRADGGTGPRDVVIRCYDISNGGALAPALSLAAWKTVHWFPKLTVSVGDQAWAYDGEIERTNDAVVAAAAGGAAAFVCNLGPCAYDDAGVEAVLRSLEGAYNEAEYDFFFRNCNHFAADAGRRLSQTTGVEEELLDEFVLVESESLLCNMPNVQRGLTMAVTRQVQRLVIVAWRRQWKKALAEDDARRAAAG
ncbi:hypothetical protein M885DRAFT_513222 [Pelagophyceae sp. CCMP2097]|nr:hypothetical protein M885DRAFT_513222 [Pelagophyceae sp. CCMP2097]